ncbi:NLR family CARD domain-containing protein 4-like [Diadema setosum]|uniref:NLR family CARD domain-containing protein 4-like n=1 Tax=Diadema setosum TaxID=31175 RepID=UPI003B3B44DF
MRKTPIAFEELLTKIESGELSKRHLIMGEGGVGKTTLCSKIAWDWCQGRILKDLDMVIVIPLREVKNNESIGVIVKKYLDDSNAITANQIDEYILANQAKILLVADGFDEFNGKLSKKNSSEFIDIIALHKYKLCRVIVTTRPWRTNEFTLDKSLAQAYTFISVDGFNTGNMAAYIRRYFRIREEHALAEDLISFMEENDVIRSNMAPFPIYCAMLCLMWYDLSEERRKEMQKLQTFSEIFGEMIHFLKDHYASKYCDNLENENVNKDIEKANRAVQAISETALNGLLERTLQFPEKQFAECRDAMKTCCKVGVLTIETSFNRKHRGVSSTVSFPHKLFQEYIAGKQIGTLFSDDRREYNKVKKKLLRQYEEFRYLLYFSSASKKELGLDIIDGLIKKGDKYFCLDVAFECHTEEAASAVGKQCRKMCSFQQG